ncbi:CLPTM1 domain-containing protein, putative [Plasmodium vinckei brucechwatti]|uniref:CLPTM1 domain-containing protein, putative n=1 Tax=Plasmodium vinckei brucechwatti TaxID=119398 RepID=A0A6V7S6S4_PLAVN|nr:CLPTM1 domain-containing protein, putative [Plasmodium vinckei brucechwatti]
MDANTATTPAPAGQGQNANGNENQRVPFFQKIISIIVQMLIMHTIMNFMSGGKNKIDPKNESGNINNLVLRNSFENDDIFDIYVFLSNNHSLDFEYIQKNSKLIQIREKELYSYKQFSKYEKLEYSFYLDDTWKGEKYLSVIAIPLHCYDKRNESSLLKSTIKKSFKQSILVDNIPLTVKKEPFEADKDEKYNLMKDDYKVKKKKKKEEFYHIKKRIDINIIHDLSKHRVSEFNIPQLKNWKININARTYTPPLFLSDFWLIENDYYVLDNDFFKDKEKRVNYISVYDPYMIRKNYQKNNKKNNLYVYPDIIEKNSDENKLISIDINYGVCGFMYYMFVKQMDASILMMEKKQSFSLQNLSNVTAHKEINMMKKILMTTNIYMLIFSAVFILLHTIFSFFAFKNDMQFWHQNESMEGLSALSVITSFVCDIILALYLYDSEDTSWLLLFEMFLGVALSAWKVTKAVNVSFSKQYPYIIMKDKKNYTESMTKKYDKIAVKYVGIVLIPCFIGYAIYSLFYNKYKSWYSYIISVLAGTVYTFGFIMMTPQLYINYKLKSVEHLPWKALIYKSLNTFIDDIAFFLIDMPWMHKLSCFRDDVIFLCYIYQRCIYRVDKNRKNTLLSKQQNENGNDSTQPNQIQSGDSNKKND